MLIKPITYTDYNGDVRTENFHFHISKNELIEKQLEDLDTNIYISKLKEISKAKDIKTLYDNFKWIILGSYGERTPDGRNFVKTEEQTRLFEQSAAFEALYEEMLVNAVAASNFVNEVFPRDMEQFAERVHQNAQRAKMEGTIPGTAKETLEKLGVPQDVMDQFPTTPQSNPFQAPPTAPKL